MSVLAPPPVRDSLFGTNDSVIKSLAWVTWFTNLKTLLDSTSFHVPATVGGAPLTISGQEITFNYDSTTLGLSGSDLYVKNDGHTHATQYLALSGSNANTNIDVGSYNFTTTGNITCTHYEIATSTVLAIGGTQSVQVGVSAGNGGTGGNMVAVGFEAAMNNTAAGTVAIGWKALRANTSALYCTAIGAGAGYGNTGAGNTWIGYGAGEGCSTGSECVGIGYRALYINGAGHYNVGVGSQAGRYNTGRDNFYFGVQAGFYQGTGNYNIFMGTQSGMGTGAYNVSNCICLGYQSGYNNTSSSKLFIETSNSAYPLIGGDFSSDYVDINASTAETATIHNVLNLQHVTSGTAAALFGISSTTRMEDAAGNLQASSEHATLWADATSGSESPLLRENTCPAGSSGPGYRGLWAWSGVDGTARTVVPNGTGDVAQVGYFTYLVREQVGGGTASGSIEIALSASSNIYADGTDTLTLAVAADGSVSVQRTAGADTFDVVITALWLS